jgi:autotransporter-associated beta strand protein
VDTLIYQLLKVRPVKNAFSMMGMATRSALLLLALLSYLAAPRSAQAADLIWSGNNVSDGNAGTWDTTNAHWSSTSGGPYTTVWSNSPINNAILQGTPGTMTTGAAITVGTITINTALNSTTSSWVLGNSTTATTNKITFSGANAGINANYTSGTSFVRNAAQGTLTKTGTGRVELDNTGMGITQYFLNAGSLTVPNINRIGTAPGSLVPDFFTFNGGGFAINTATTADLGATRGVKVLAGGAFFSTASNGTTATISAPIIGTAGGNVTVGGTSAVWTGSGHTSGGTWILSNTSNSWDGNLVLNGSGTAPGTQVKLGAAGVIPDTAVVTIAASGNVFDLNGFDETVKSISGTAGTIALGTKKLTLANPAGESSASVLTGTAGSQLVKNGSGALTLTGGSSGFSGEIVLNNGTLGIGGVNSLGSNAAGPTLQINGAKISNNSGTGRSMSANLKVNVNADFIADDSLAGGNAGQITFQGVSTLVGGDKTITVNGTANIGFDDLRETVAGTKLTKDGTGTLSFTNNANAASAFTGEIEVKAGKLQVGGTPIIGTGNNTIKLNGGALNTSATRTISSNPVTNPINVVADSAITTTSTAGAVNLALTSNSITGTSGKTLTIRNDGGADNTKVFMPRFMGSGFDFQSKIAVAAGVTGAKTQLQFANTGATIQTFSGDISGSGSLYRTSGNPGSGNGGTTILAGNNTYTGGTTIDEGTLLANNTTGSATGTGDVNVQGGKLGGTGTIGGNVIVSGGTLAPGASINSLAIGGNLSMSGGSFGYEIDSTSVTADLLTVGGNFDITGAVALAATDLGSSVLAMGTKFTLINYAGTWNGGSFSGLPNYSTTLTIGSNRFAIRYDDPTNGSNFTGDLLGSGKFVTITAVPEATSFITVGLGGIFAIAAVWMSKRMGVNVLKA